MKGARLPFEVLEQQFTDALWATEREATQLGHSSSVFRDMLDKYGGVETARRLVKAGEIQGGMRTICAMGRSDLTTEAVMLKPEYAPLFKRDELNAARWRLDQVGG
jgi:hypothetical protein